MSLHLELHAAIAEHYAGALTAPLELRQDALLARLQNGVALEIRYAAADAYCLRWTWGDAELCIDTAPCHGELETAPNHFHDAGGALQPDPITRCGAPPWHNIRDLMDALLRSPLDPRPE
ncbi:MAG: hypothetical protein KF778_06665 [Rhodocyclaceae bacterium]|nr:hypothetical protein [Rhodocyclaceae bacterium]MBX3668069.1 hypothetical protein [Rhodocyclaceae bacterium]